MIKLFKVIYHDKNNRFHITFLQDIEIEKTNENSYKILQLLLNTLYLSLIKTESS